MPLYKNVCLYSRIRKTNAARFVATTREHRVFLTNFSQKIVKNDTIFLNSKKIPINKGGLYAGGFT